MIAQIVLLRELLVTYYGNELTIGIILSNWLLIEAVGALLGRRVENKRRKLEVYITITLLFSISLPFFILCARILKNLLGVVPGEGLGLWYVLVSSICILLVPSITHGFLFTQGCSILADQTGSGAKATGTVYLYEIIGTATGGLALTYLLLPRYHSFRIALFLLVLNTLICLSLLRFTNRRTSTAVLTACTILCLAGSLTLLISHLDDKLHHGSVQLQWRSGDVVYYHNSRYGNIAVMQNERQHTIFSDGLPAVTMPVPDIEHVESMVHLPLLLHPEPEVVLIIGGGAEGLLGEVLKHPVRSVDYVELDPLIIEAVRRFASQETLKPLQDPRVHIENTDGRRFLKTAGRSYDVIIVGLSDPTDLQANRLFTVEFIQNCFKNLRDGGIVIMQASGSMSYLSMEMKKLNSCFIRTLKTTFPTLFIIPGDTVLYIAQKNARHGTNKHRPDPNALIDRLNTRELETTLISPFYIEYRLDPQRLTWFIDNLQGTETKPNKDFLPACMLYALSVWNARFSPGEGALLLFLDRIRTATVMIALSAIVLSFLVAGILLRGRALRSAIPLSVASSGYAGMLFDLILIFTFQVLYGYIFLLIGALVTAFMAGSGTAGFIATRRLERFQRVRRLWIFLEFGIMAFALLLTLPSLIGFQDSGNWINQFPEIYFFTLCFIGGFLIGFQFPLANSMYLSISAGAGRTAGLLYGADLLGGFIGGLTGSIFLLPVLGLTGTCMSLILLKASTLILFVLSSGGLQSSTRRPNPETAPH
jgi:spermidine synthase